MLHYLFQFVQFFLFWLMDSVLMESIKWVNQNPSAIHILKRLLYEINCVRKSFSITLYLIQIVWLFSFPFEIESIGLHDTVCNCIMDRCRHIGLTRNLSANWLDWSANFCKHIYQDIQANNQRRLWQIGTKNRLYLHWRMDIGCYFKWFVQYHFIKIQLNNFCNIFFFFLAFTLYFTLVIHSLYRSIKSVQQPLPLYHQCTQSSNSITACNPEYASKTT